MHGKLRAEACDYMKRNKDLYKDFMEDDCSIDEYIEYMRKDSTWGGQVEMNILSQLYKFNSIVH